MEAALQASQTPRQRVERLESILANAPQAECPVQHHFAPGVYLRTMVVPAGVIATGAIHKTEHLTIVAGHCLLTTDDGLREFVGYETFLSKPGAKRAIHALEITVVTTVHVTDETDLDKLCELLTESKPDQLLGAPRSPQVLAQQVQLARNDFPLMLEEVGVTAEWAYERSRATFDQTEFPVGYEHLSIKPSPVEGMGLFTLRDIQAGDIIGPARIGDKRTPLGRYANHSPNANAEFRCTEDGGLLSVALRDIRAGDEILNDYRQGARLARESTTEVA